MGLIGWVRSCGQEQTVGTFSGFIGGVCICAFLCTCQPAGPGAWREEEEDRERMGQTGRQATSIMASSSSSLTPLCTAAAWPHPCLAQPPGGGGRRTPPSPLWPPPPPSSPASKSRPGILRHLSFFPFPLAPNNGQAGAGRRQWRRAGPSPPPPSSLYPTFLLCRNRVDNTA